MGINYNPKIVTDGLVLCLDAANKRSYPGTGTTWSDLKGSNNGTLTNMTDNFDSVNGGVLTFDGTNEYVLFSDDMINVNQDFTLSSFLNVSSDSNISTIVGANHSSNNTMQVRFETSGSVKILHSALAGVGTFTNFTRSLNVWFNIIVTRSSNTYSLYVDGDFKSSFTSSLTYNNNPKSIGTRDSFAEYFNGKIANLSLYNRALSAVEVLQNYNATKGRYQ